MTLWEQWYPEKKASRQQRTDSSKLASTSIRLATRCCLLQKWLITGLFVGKLGSLHHRHRRFVRKEAVKVISGEKRGIANSK
jgi:hypothetical protein